MRSAKTRQPPTKTRSNSCLSLGSSIRYRTTPSKAIERNNQVRPTNLLTGTYRGSNIEQSNITAYKRLPIQLQNIIRLKMKPQPKTCKSTQELLEQNIQLKTQINKLKQQMVILKSQLNVNYKRKQEVKLGNQIEIQYEKDRYFANNQKSFRVIGMRKQYQKLKKQYNQTMQQNKQLRVLLAETGVIQAKIYANQLENQLKRLKNLFLQSTNQRYKNQSKQIIKNAEALQKQLKNSSIPNSFNINMSESKIYKTITNTQQYITQLRNKIKQKDNKISFLQKLIISKDNKQYSVARRIRKIQKQNQSLVNSYNNLLQQAKVMKTKLELQNIKFKSYYTQQINKIKRQKKRQIFEKQKIIKQLQETVKNFQQQNANNKNVKLNSSTVLTKSIAGLNMKSTRKASHDYGTRNNLLIVQQEDFAISRRYASQQNQKVFQKFQSANSNSQVLIKLDLRQPKRANRRHSDKSERLRKVQYSQIQNIGQLLRYRMIGFKIQPSHLKQFFLRKMVYTEQSERCKSKDEKQFFEVMQKVNNQESYVWQDEYITMRQTMEILQKQPFNLTDKQSYILARYLIEDCQQQYVFCDMQNQNKRDIVKSIIKTIIGQYKLINQQQYKGFNEMMFRYSLNLKSTLNSYYPDGIITKIKLLQIVKGIGADLNPKQRQLMIAKLSLTSKSLNQLSYQPLFQKSY